MASITAKMARLAPMQIASVSPATAVKPGFFSNWRNVKRRSFISQRHHRVDFGRTARGDVTGQERDDGEHSRYNDKRGWIGRRHAKQQLGQEPRHHKCATQAEADAN